MAEEKKLTKAEVRKTTATSLGAAFGFVIGLVWSYVVLGAFATADINLTQPKEPGNWVGWGIFVVIALVLTVIMVLMIIMFSRWGNKE